MRGKHSERCTGVHPERLDDSRRPAPISAGIYEGIEMSSISVNKVSSEVDRVDVLHHPAVVQRKAATIWIDLDNSPHVPFFRPIIRVLEEHGYPVVVTARDCFQVCGLAEQLDLKCKPIGRHYGKNTAMKLLGVGVRSVQLLPSVLGVKPALAVSHGSRSQLMAATLLGIPTLQIVDYEFAKIWMGVRPSWVLTPNMIPDNAIQMDRERVLKYPGIKEDVYVPSFVPEDGIRRALGISEDEILVTLRPPASEAHYHAAESDTCSKQPCRILRRCHQCGWSCYPELRGKVKASASHGQSFVPAESSQSRSRL